MAQTDNSKKEKLHILIADDVQETRRNTRLMIATMDNVEVTAIASNGLQAVEMTKEYRPDIVILDMNMPNYDGAYALEKIKQDYPDAKIVVVTGFTNYTFEKEQADAIFTKPYDLEPFIDTVNKIALATPTIVK